MHDFPTALQTAAAIRAKELSPSEALEEVLRRVEERNPGVNAVIWADDDDARARAHDADDLVVSTPPDELPPFCGVPLPIKDLNNVAGWPNTYGSHGASDAPRPESDLVVTAFERGGFTLAGRTNTPEFGPITAAENVRYGISRNPWSTAHTPGGSSGGAAAAVASGMYPIAHANDGGGSIRIPAACCGLVGLKVGRGRVPVVAQSWEGASVEGVVSHTLADTAAVLDLISGPDRLGWWNAPAPERPFAAEVGAPVEALRVAVLADAPLEVATDPACVAACEATAAALEAAGHHLVDVVPDFDTVTLVSHFLTVVNSGLAAYDDLVDWDRVEPHNQHSRRAAGEVDCVTYAKSVAALQEWTRRINAMWGDQFDVLVTPTMPILPAPAGQILGEIQADPENLSDTVFRSVLFTAAFNVSGLPAISLPLHQAPNGLPVGVQLVAGPWEEARLLRLAAQLEDQLPWRDRHPDLSALLA